MSTYTKKKLVQEIAKQLNLHPNDVQSVLQLFLDHMIDNLSKGHRMEFRDFGVFEVILRKQKIGRNPKNAKVPVVIPAKAIVKFTPGKRMKEEVEKIPLDQIGKAQEEPPEVVKQNPEPLPPTPSL